MADSTGFSLSSNNTPLAKYQRDLQRPDFQADEAQKAAVTLLDELYFRMLKRARANDSWKTRLSTLFAQPKPEKGLYFWGGVGRGKTYLMDTFFSCLPFEKKKRLHFHRFMHNVHHQLKVHKGKSDPLEKIADKMAENILIICFDEFFVSDITDAMILAGLFKALFNRGVTLVATSNIPPERLYWNGLQRDRFLPAIELIRQHCHVNNLDGGVDYRLRALEQAEIFHYPLDEAALENLNKSFDWIAGQTAERSALLEIEGREIATEKLAEGIVWFTFDAICNTPRSHVDYIEISRCYHTVLISDMPQLFNHTNDAMRRFISLVDEFYERNVKLILAAEVALEDVYKGSGLKFEFQRTLSRLQEMQSHEYLAKPHLA